MPPEPLIRRDLPTAPGQAWIHPADTARACLIFLDGELYTDRVQAPEAIAAAQHAGSLPPLTCVYLPNRNAADRHEFYTCNDRFAAFVALELPRWIEREVGRFERLFLCGGMGSVCNCLTDAPRMTRSPQRRSRFSYGDGRVLTAPCPV